MALEINVGRVVGDSAYEIAVKNGFTGTEQEWLESLKGDSGSVSSESIEEALGYTPANSEDVAQAIADVNSEFTNYTPTSELSDTIKNLGFATNDEILSVTDIIIDRFANGDGSWREASVVTSTSDGVILKYDDYASDGMGGTHIVKLNNEGFKYNGHNLVTTDTVGSSVNSYLMNNPVNSMTSAYGNGVSSIFFNGNDIVLESHDAETYNNILSVGPNGLKYNENEVITTDNISDYIPSTTECEFDKWVNGTSDVYSKKNIDITRTEKGYINIGTNNTPEENAVSEGNIFLGYNLNGNGSKNLIALGQYNNNSLSPKNTSYKFVIGAGSNSADGGLVLQPNQYQPYYNVNKYGNTRFNSFAIDNQGWIYYYNKGNLECLQDKINSFVTSEDIATIPATSDFLVNKDNASININEDNLSLNAVDSNDSRNNSSFTLNPSGAVLEINRVLPDGEGGENVNTTYINFDDTGITLDGQDLANQSWVSAWVSENFASSSELEELKLFKFPNATIYGTPTINNGQISNFTADNYLQFPFIVNFQNRPFTILASFTTGSNVSSQENIFDSEFGLAFAIKDSHFVLATSTNGTNWNVGAYTGSYTVQPNTTYYVKIEWDGDYEKVSYSLDNGEYTEDITVSSSSSPAPKKIIIGKSVDNQHIFTGIINFNYCSLTISDKVVWSGMDDVGLATRLAVDLSNIDEDGKKYINSLIDEKVSSNPSTPSEDVVKTVDYRVSEDDSFWFDWASLRGDITDQDDENFWNQPQTNLYFDSSSFNVFNKDVNGNGYLHTIDSNGFFWQTELPEGETTNELRFNSDGFFLNNKQIATVDMIPEAGGSGANMSDYVKKSVYDNEHTTLTSTNNANSSKYSKFDLYYNGSELKTNDESGYSRIYSNPSNCGLGTILNNGIQGRVFTNNQGHVGLSSIGEGSSERTETYQTPSYFQIHSYVYGDTDGTQAKFSKNDGIEFHSSSDIFTFNDSPVITADNISNYIPSNPSADLSKYIINESDVPLSEKFIFAGEDDKDDAYNRIYLKAKDTIGAGEFDGSYLDMVSNFSKDGGYNVNSYVNLYSEHYFNETDNIWGGLNSSINYNSGDTGCYSSISSGFNLGNNNASADVNLGSNLDGNNSILLGLNGNTVFNVGQEDEFTENYSHMFQLINTGISADIQTADLSEELKENAGINFNVSGADWYSNYIQRCNGFGFSIVNGDEGITNEFYFVYNPDENRPMLCISDGETEKEVTTKDYVNSRIVELTEVELETYEKQDGVLYVVVES